MTRLRPLAPDDWDAIAPVVDDWWGGRTVRHLLPRLFFEHFNDTSFALVDGDHLVGFLVGFVSQSQPGIAYIHFVGVAPEARGQGAGRRLYETFFAAVVARGCTEVACITSPQNADSRAFHAAMGFENRGVCENHAGPGKPRVELRRRLER